MSSDWMDDLADDDILFDGEETADFYCPYTNGPECALMTKNWKPQDLCESIECSQLRLFTRIHKHKAA
ncbi:MAG: hypothetical protein ACYC64_00390 [Armatimonadota bacterium]